MRLWQSTSSVHSFVEYVCVPSYSGSDVQSIARYRYYCVGNGLVCRALSLVVLPSLKLFSVWPVCEFIRAPVWLTGVGPVGLCSLWVYVSIFRAVPTSDPNGGCLSSITSRQTPMQRKQTALSVFGIFCVWTPVHSIIPGQSKTSFSRNCQQRQYPKQRWTDRLWQKKNSSLDDRAKRDVVIILYYELITAALRAEQSRAERQQWSTSNLWSQLMAVAIVAEGRSGMLDWVYEQPSR